MPRKKVLFISGSLGLGHIGRDLAIAGELRKRFEYLDIDWLAGPPADAVVREAGENVLPEARQLADENAVAEAASEGARLNLFRYLMDVRNGWSRNVEVVDRLTAHAGYDLVIGDETYDLAVAYKKEPERKHAPFVMIYDFIGADAVTWNPLERLGIYLLNRSWCQRVDPRPVDLSLFIGEPEDVPDRPFGPWLPNRRAWAREVCDFVGYVLTFDPAQHADRQGVRARLGYDGSPLVVCTVGGTAIGRDLLELCGRAFPLAADRMPGLRMLLVSGPRIDPASLDVPAGVDVRGYVPALHEHLAASDLAVVQGGGTVTLELTALRRPFLYFPLEDHYEQELHVAPRLERHRAGRRMAFSATTPETLARAIVENIGAEVRYASVPVDGARVAAEKISGLL